jgi:very-short-patch-repair endonuclease
VPKRALPPVNRQLAKAMRQRMTGAEMRLWSRLRKPGIGHLRFRRQAPIGPYIVDFFCPQQKLIVEVDGEQHAFHRAGEADRVRDAWLESQGYRVIRFSNREVSENLVGVCDTILLNAGNQPET